MLRLLLLCLFVLALGALSIRSDATSSAQACDVIDCPPPPSLFAQLNTDIDVYIPPGPPGIVARNMALRAESLYPTSPVHPPSPCAAFQPFEVSFNAFRALAKFTTALEPFEGQAIILTDIAGIQQLVPPGPPASPACRR